MKFGRLLSGRRKKNKKENSVDKATGGGTLPKKPPDTQKKRLSRQSSIDPQEFEKQFERMLDDMNLTEDTKVEVVHHWKKIFPISGVIFKGNFYFF